jgi:ATP-dependent DNA helicase
MADSSMQLFSNIMLSQMQAREDEVVAETEAPKARRGRPKKSDAGKISGYFKKDDVAAKAGEGGVGAAMKEAVEEEIKATDVGYQAPKSAAQPKLVSGGTMRKYQLEGLEWLKSLYENGLNGILADEMGLGKTIQTISLLAFLREMDTHGPFLIVAPLSTTTNWVNEFHKWTPKIPVILYHGSIPERAEIRAKKLKNPGSASFPVVVTSYDICMNDRKFLANYGWKFIIVVSQATPLQHVSILTCSLGRRSSYEES